eukprot:3280958-Pyramimonas_sp.AAC.1
MQHLQVADAALAVALAFDQLAGHLLHHELRELAVGAEALEALDHRSRGWVRHEIALAIQP